MRALDRLHREWCRRLRPASSSISDGRRIEAVEAHLRFDRIAVGRKRAGLDQDRVALARRPVEADHHQVQVGRQRIHRHHFRRLRADAARPAIRARTRGRASMGAGRGSGLPRLAAPSRRALPRSARRARPSAAGPANCRRNSACSAAVVLRDVEFVAEVAQRIGGVQRLRVGFVAEAIRHRAGHVSRTATLVQAEPFQRRAVVQARLFAPRPGRARRCRCPAPVRPAGTDSRCRASPCRCRQVSIR